MSTPVATPENQIVAAAQTPSGSEMAQLSTAIQEWKRVHDELVELRQESREKGKRVKVLEDVIMRIMKKNNIGALDLKSSGGRLLYKRKAAKSDGSGRLRSRGGARVCLDNFSPEASTATGRCA